MTDELRPIPETGDRAALSEDVRHEAELVSRRRHMAPSAKNNEETKAALLGGDDEMVAAHGTFTKGLTHDMYGRVRRGDLRSFVSEINQDGNGPTYKKSPFPQTYSTGKAAPLSAPLHKQDDRFIWPAKDAKKARRWESPLSGERCSRRPGLTCSIW